MMPNKETFLKFILSIGQFFLAQALPDESAYRSISAKQMWLLCVCL